MVQCKLDSKTKTKQMMILCKRSHYPQLRHKIAASSYITNKIQKGPYTMTNNSMASLLLYLSKKYNQPPTPSKNGAREREEKGARKTHLRKNFFFMNNNLLIEKGKALVYEKYTKEANTLQASKI